MAQLMDVVPRAVAGVLDRDRTLRLGSYQVDVLKGRAAWSGADLQGRAKSYGGRYRDARRSALAKVQGALRGTGVDVRVERLAHGRLVLAWYICGMPVTAWREAAERPGLAGMTRAEE